MIVQLPLPKNLDEEKIVQTISPLKDVDGLCNENLGLLASGSPKICSCNSIRNTKDDFLR